MIARVATLPRELLRLPLLLKILTANAAIVGIVAVTTAAVSARSPSVDPLATVPSATFIVAAGALASVLVNWAILHLALWPLRLIEQTARCVQAGDLDARAVISPLADRELERVATTLNAVLDDVALHRRRLRAVGARAADAAERERQRIARELHDGIAQTLAAIRLRLRLVRATTEPDLHDHQLSGISAEIGEAIEELRRIARGLRPVSLDVLGLADAIESYARPLADACGLGLELRTEPVAGLLAHDAELALFRILQEALANVLHHSRAHSVSIGLRAVDRTVELVVEDDGRGYVVAEVIDGDGRGLGLLGMQERASYVGGRVDITSAPGHGTRITAAVPAARSV